METKHSLEKEGRVEFIVFLGRFCMIGCLHFPLLGSVAGNERERLFRVESA